MVFLQPKLRWIDLGFRSPSHLKLRGQLFCYFPRRKYNDRIKDLMNYKQYNQFMLKFCSFIRKQVSIITDHEK